jgi:hypothetical protein
MTFPSVFAVVRTQNYRQPCFQLLQSNESTTRYHRHELPHYTITNLDGVSLDRLPLHRMVLLRTSSDSQVYTLRYKLPSSTEIQEVYYWYLPYSLGLSAIPILEFQYRSWLPTQYRPVEINMNRNEFIDVLSVIQEERLEQIRRMEDRQRFVRPPAAWGPDDWDDRILEDSNTFVGVNRRRRSILRTPTPPPPRERRIVERVVEVPVERVVVQTRMQALPKPMAKVLLANARQGEESCPITATPFSECSKISLTSCFHFFETEALAKWQGTHNTCPVCRSTVETVVSEE